MPYHLIRNKRSIISPVVHRLLSETGAMTRAELVDELGNLGYHVPRTTLYDALRPGILIGNILCATRGRRRSARLGRGRPPVYFVLASLERSFLETHPGYKIHRSPCILSCLA